LIRRILAFFDGEKENIMAGQRKAPKRRKSTPKTKKSSPKEDAKEEEAPKKKAAPAKKAPAPAPAPVEEEPEDEVSEEEDAEATEDLDLDNLDSHSLAELKKYCEEEEIKVKGTKKTDYMAAITAYNEAEDEDEEEH